MAAIEGKQERQQPFGVKWDYKLRLAGGRAAAAEPKATADYDEWEWEAGDIAPMRKIPTRDNYLLCLLPPS
jgi:hypothetical protein